MRLRKLRSTIKGMSMSMHLKSVSGSAGARRSGTRPAIFGYVIATCITFVASATPIPCGAADISVMVLDREGRGVGEVVVTGTPAGSGGPTAVPTVDPKPKVMDQRNRAFIPQVMVVSAGTSVEFPNNDSVSHQVYSFSPAKRFQLPLYKGEVHPPITFDQPGLVVLGCNIHDSMVGYIYVTAAPHYGMTDADGALKFADLPKGDYRIVIWSPYIGDTPPTLVRTIHVDGNESATARIQLSAPLRARPEPTPRRRDWDY
jgi:plastocyanin